MDAKDVVLEAMKAAGEPLNAGKIVEHTDVLTLYRSPKHPYTQGLLASIPTTSTPKAQRLNVISGTVPNLLRLPRGCRFAARCPHAMPVCREQEPGLARVDKTDVACWLYEPKPATPVTAEEPANGSV